MAQRRYGAVIIDSKKKFSATSKPGKTIIGEYLLGLVHISRSSLAQHTSIKRAYLRLSGEEQRSEVEYRRRLSALTQVAEESFNIGGETHRALIRAQKAAASILEARWKQRRLLFAYREQLGISQEEANLLMRQMKSLSNSIRDLYREIEEPPKQ